MLYFYNMSIHAQFDATFKALASPIRRQILDDLKDQPLTTGALCGHFADIDRCTVMQHLKVLEDAGLVIAERRGRTRAGPCLDARGPGERHGGGSGVDGCARRCAPSPSSG